MAKTLISRNKFYLPRSIQILLALCIIPEIILQLTDRGMLGAQNLRMIALRIGAFQSDLVTTQHAVFPGQSFTMYISYMFLHIGLPHLMVNMTGLIIIWRLILDRRAPIDTALLYLMSGIGAALVFTAIGPEHTAMVGASGALFGLLGVYGVDSHLFWPKGNRTDLLHKTLRIIAIAAALVISDTISQVAFQTHVAWQAHIGGFLTGAALAMIWTRK